MKSDHEGCAQAELFWRGLPGGESPQVDGEPPSGGHGVFSSLPGTKGGAVDERPHRFVVWLPASEAPDQFDQGGAHGAIPTTVDGAFAPATITLVHAGTQAGVAGDLPAIAETRPVANLAGEDDPGQSPDSPGQVRRCRGLELRAQGTFSAIEVECDGLPLRGEQTQPLGQRGCERIPLHRSPPILLDRETVRDEQAPTAGLSHAAHPTEVVSQSALGPLSFCGTTTILFTPKATNSRCSV